MKTQLTGPWLEMYKACGEDKEVLKEKLGVDYGTVWRWATGKTRPSSRAHLERLAELCNEFHIENPFPWGPRGV